MCDYITKVCNKCNQELPLTIEYFHSAKTKLGFRGICRICYNKQRVANANPEKRKESDRKRYEKDKQARIDYNREWRKKNPEKAKASARKRQKDYRERNPEKVKRTSRNLVWESKYRKANKQKLTAKFHRQMARRKQLPYTLTNEQWQYAIDYFGGCCAVCGRQAKLALDHWIPVSSPDCTGTVVTNVVPLCHGQNGCNNSKNDKMPEQWLIQKYGVEKASKILNRIQAYFDSVME